MFRRILPLVLTLLGGCAFLPFTFSSRTDPPAIAAIEPLRLTTTSGTICNSVRLDSNTIATAAHCIEAGQSLTVTEAGQSVFAANAIRHPAYDLAPPASSAGVDLAQVFLPAPHEAFGRVVIRPIQPGPVEIRVVGTSGANLVIPCDYLGRSGTIVELSCRVSLGWSGAPVVQDGALVGILSARGRTTTANIVQVADATLLNTF